MLYPLTFQPIFKERIWGGRKLADLYGKPLPAEVPIGESWEICDRPGDVSVISNGPLAGKDLHWILKEHGAELLGKSLPAGQRFPLLIKILDAREKLSLQVHPPAEKAAALGGEPKTEMWHIVDADPGAELYVGLRAGVTRSEFEKRIISGGVADCFHRIAVRAGDTMFLPSGRVHAIGSGLVIFEIQQNSDTTYRVFDWNRLGSDGQPRQLHIPQSLESIDFRDFEPSLASGGFLGEDGAQIRTLTSNPLFTVRGCRFGSNQVYHSTKGKMEIIGVVSGSLTVVSSGFEQHLQPGQFCLIPASCENVSVSAAAASEFLTTTLGS